VVMVGVGVMFMVSLSLGLKLRDVVPDLGKYM